MISNISSKSIKKLAKKLDFTKIKGIISEIGFLTSEAGIAFIQLRKTFTKTLILYYFDREYHIWYNVINT